MTIEEVVRGFTELRRGDVDRFSAMASAVYRHQVTQSEVYSRYCARLLEPEGPRSSSSHDRTADRGIASAAVFSLPDTPFLPVEAFKHAPVTTFDPADADLIFESSGTGSGLPARHYIRDRELYERSVLTQFTHVFGEGPFVVVAHLPEYAERSSLVYMCRHLIESVGESHSGFFLDDLEVLTKAANFASSSGATLVVIGASFGLLDLVDAAQIRLPADAVVIETGGMKTHRRETPRSILHERLALGFRIDRSRIRSEYGMCELLSQCYTTAEGLFYTPGWMDFVVLNPMDAASPVPEGEPGALSVIDLANVHSCSFLLTGDRAVRRGEGFEVLGRLSGAELRGCNFLMEDA